MSQIFCDIENIINGISSSAPGSTGFSNMRLPPAEKAGAVKIKYNPWGISSSAPGSAGFSNMRLPPAEKAGAVKIKYNPWGISSSGRAPALHAGGEEFDSPILHHL